MIDYSDQTDIFDPSKFGWPVHLVGLGGIGSAVLFPLLKLGVKELHIWDADKVEPHNIPAQLIYRPSDIGMTKAAAACAFIERQEADCRVTPHVENVSADTSLEGVVISGVDSMRSRYAIWHAVTHSSMYVPLYMDGRIGGEQLQLLTVHPSDFRQAEKYERWLFPDEEASPLPCAARTVIHPPTVLAGLMVTQLTLFARGEPFRANVIAHLKKMQFTTTTEVVPS